MQSDDHYQDIHKPVFQAEIVIEFDSLNQFPILRLAWWFIVDVMSVVEPLQRLYVDSCVDVHQVLPKRQQRCLHSHMQIPNKYQNRT
jgi:hypothetical protein